MTHPAPKITASADQGVTDGGLRRVPEVEVDCPRPERSDLAALVECAAAGDSGAWDALVDRFASTVWAIARGHRLSAADAADVSQTTWLRLVENLHRIEQPDRVGAWLAVTARRESLRVLRVGSRQTANGHEFEQLPDPAPPKPPDHAVATREWETVVADLIAQLPPRSQLLIRHLSADSPLSYKDISEALDMPIGSIGPTRARALEQLRRLAIQAGIEPEDVFC
jgi:RNA polymerase sigma factor (sigma-70 family)